MADSGTVKFHADPIFHSRAADIRGEESNVVCLTLLNLGIELVQKEHTGTWSQSIIQPKILQVQALCKILMESKIIAASKDEVVLNPNTLHYSYFYPAMLPSPGSSIPTAHSYITIYDNYALQPTEPINFITNYETFVYAISEHYIMAVVHFESDYKTLRRIIQREHWGKIAVFIPPSDVRKGITTSHVGIKYTVRPLGNDWTAPSV